MKKVEVYFKATCGYCRRAFEILARHGVEPIKIDVDSDPKLWEECQTRSGRNTVPQIYIGDYHVGGCDDLMMLDKRNQLDDYLSGKLPQ